MTKNKNNRPTNTAKNDKMIDEKQQQKNPSGFGKNKVLLIKVGVAIACAAVVAMIIIIVNNQTLFQEFIRVL